MARKQKMHGVPMKYVSELWWRL